MRKYCLYKLVPLFNNAAFCVHGMFATLLYQGTNVHGDWVNDFRKVKLIWLYTGYGLAMMAHLLAMYGTFVFSLLGIGLSWIVMVPVLLIGAYQTMCFTLGMAGLLVMCSLAVIYSTVESHQSDNYYNEGTNILPTIPFGSFELFKRGNFGNLLSLLSLFNMCALCANLVFGVMLYDGTDLFNWKDGYKKMDDRVMTSLLLALTGHWLTIYAYGNHNFNIGATIFSVTFLVGALVLGAYEAMLYTAGMAAISIMLSIGLINWMVYSNCLHFLKYPLA